VKVYFYNLKVIDTMEIHALCFGTTLLKKM